MKADDSRVDKFISKNETTFVIPVYQRNYDWTLIQCRQLLSDIIEAGKNENLKAHFIGSIVYVHDDVYTATGITDLTIIDGQQRLTTITLIYIVLYKLAKKLDNQMLENKIYKNYLINEFSTEPEKLKLKPTDNNREALNHILYSDEDSEYNGYSKIVENFLFFKKEITLENLEIVQKGLSKLLFVDIALDRQNDNPQRIFESLNSTGLALSQADLIRNYILMGLNNKSQDLIYRNYWEVIEKKAKDEGLNKTKVSEFIRDFLTLKNQEIPNKGLVYQTFKKKFPTTSFEELEVILSEIKSLSKFYNKLLNPQNETDTEIRIHLDFINKLEINVAYPFLMKVYEDYSKDVIDKQIFISILLLIQSFTFRRFIVGLPTNALNKIFMTLYDKVDISNYLYSIQNSLIQKSSFQRFPRNTETINALKEKDLYNINSKNRTYLLERLENFQNNEIVKIEGNNNITIEHIFPQNPEPSWKIDLGAEEYNFIKDNYLNTIGNLTLSGNNGKLSNKSFIEKRDMNIDGKEQGYKYSRLWLNRDLINQSKWTKKEIEERAAKIAERFIKVWEFPEINEESVFENSELNIFDADDPKFKKLEYAIFFDQKLEVKEISKLYKEVFKTLFELQPETFFSSEIGKKISISNNPDIDELRQPIQISETYYIEANFDSYGKFERIKQALSIFGLEDELYIKYSE
jgi:uncharacterized protein with ParB-like and HNH nuclease domain